MGSYQDRGDVVTIPTRGYKELRFGPDKVVYVRDPKGQGQVSGHLIDDVLVGLVEDYSGVNVFVRKGKVLSGNGKACSLVGGFPNGKQVRKALVNEDIGYHDGAF